MSAEWGEEDVRAVAAFLAEHSEWQAKRHEDNPWRYDGTYVCQCGTEFAANRGIGGSFTAHRAHVARALLASGVVVPARVVEEAERRYEGQLDHAHRGHLILEQKARAAEAETARLRGAIEALAEQYAQEADGICPVDVYDPQDKAWRVAHVRRRVADDLRAALAEPVGEGGQS